MIKRWIARRRRRLDLYGRLRRVEALLTDMRHALDRLDRDGRERGLIQDQAAGALNRRMDHLEEAAAGRRHAVDTAQDRLQDRLAMLEVRVHDIAADAVTALEQQRAEADARGRSEAMLHQLSIRAARLETQRQMDMEETRHLTLNAVRTLKRGVLEDRGAGDALARIDRALPGRLYVGRPWEETPSPRLRPTLAKGRPLDDAGLPGRLHIAPLAADGSPLVATPAQSSAPWIAFAPAGSVVAPDFAEAVLQAVDRHPDAAVFYADDIAVDADEAIDQIRLKPAFDVTLLAAQDYVGAPLIVRADALADLGGLDPARGTAACADLLFRAHARGMRIARIEQVLLAHPGRRVRAAAADYTAMLRAQPMLAAYDIAPGAALNTFRLARRFDGETAPVTLLIPTRRTAAPGSADTYVERLLRSIAATDWPMDRLIVIVGDDVAGDPAWARRAWPFALRRIETLRGPDEPFNYAAKMNRLWRAAETEQIVFMNDDMRAVDAGWLKALQTFALDPQVGGVGARLLFEDGSLQHAGMAPHGAGGGTVHLWIQRLGAHATYQDWSRVHREWSMVTGAVFATRRTLMQQVDGFDERFSLEFNDTDLSMRLRRAGLRIVCTPFAQLIHVERASRGGVPPPADERALFHARWDDWLADDPSWHPGLDLNRVEMTPAPNPDAWYL